MERANHSATPSAVERKEGNQCERGQRQTKHDWDDVGDSDDKFRVQMTNDERDGANDSQALTGGDITKCRALVALISYLSQDRPDPKFAAMEVCCAMANPSASNLERVKRIGRYLVVKTRVACLFHWQQSGELQAYSDADCGGDEVTRQSVSAGVIMRGGHCEKSMDQEAAGGVPSLSTAESELYAALTTASEGLGIQSFAKDLGIVCGVEPTSGCHRVDVPGQPQRIGQGETRRHAKPVHIVCTQVKKIRYEESRHEREPRRLIDEADAETGNRAAHEQHELRVCGTVFGAGRSARHEIGGKRASWEQPQQNGTQGNSQWCTWI